MNVPDIIAERFKLEDVIGKGGMGTVYKAIQLGLHRPVAVKVIKPEHAFDSSITERFMREARTMAKLRHQGAAMIFDAGSLPDGRNFIVMEFVKGVTLAQALFQEKRFKPERAVKIACEICDVLAAAHKLGIVHRDLKPSNIMLTEEGVRVLDFGVAKVIADATTDATTTYVSTLTGMIVGTPRYMSPEQCLGQKVGTKSDLYSLGILLYEMLAGRPPFTDKTQSVLMVKQATIQAQPLDKMREGLPPRLVKVVHKLLAKRSDDRPPNAETVRAMLAHSIAKPNRDIYETMPLSNTIETISAEKVFWSRWMSTALLFSLFGVLMFAIGRQWVSEAKRTPIVEAQTLKNGSEKISNLKLEKTSALKKANTKKKR